MFIVRDSEEKLFRDLFNQAIPPRGNSTTGQPNINILFSRFGITSLHKRNSSNKFQGNHFVPVIPVDVGCKRKQNPTRLKEWSTAPQSQIYFSSVSKTTISLEKLTKENTTDTVQTTVKLPPLKSINIKIEKKKTRSKYPKLQRFTYTSLKCFKQNERRNLDSNGFNEKKSIWKRKKNSISQF